MNEMVIDFSILVPALVVRKVAKYLVRPHAAVNGSTVTRSLHEDPLPQSLVYVEALGATIVGSVNGRVYRLGPRGLDDLAEQSMGSRIMTIIPTQHGPWRGVVFAGLNGFLRDLYDGADVCQPAGLTFNVGRLAASGDSWVAYGTTQPEARRPSLAWITV